jgi:sulfur-oxidizing protein SoxZ
MTNTIRIGMPKQAKAGEIISIRTLINHEMETGFRRDNMGRAVPRRIIHEFVCIYDGEEVFRAELFPAMAANPFIQFTTVATKSGPVVFRWRDDTGEIFTQTLELQVT